MDATTEIKKMVDSLLQTNGKEKMREILKFLKIYAPLILIAVNATIVGVYLIKKIFKRKKFWTFLSYSHSSKVEMNKIKKMVYSTNNYKLYDFDSISIRQNIQLEIEKMIKISQLFIILFDDNYIQSPRCSMELKAIINSKKPFIPILKSSEYVSKLPEEISKLKCIIISDDSSWRKILKKSLYEQYRKIEKEIKRGTIQW